MNNYKAQAKLIRVLGDPVRLAILDMISCREMCACDILGSLTIGQSTLSHHMSVMQKVGFVNSRKDATWVYYSINPKKVSELHEILDSILQSNQQCVCESNERENCQ